jgi:hypothetical protein
VEAKVFGNEILSRGKDTYLEDIIFVKIRYEVVRGIVDERNGGGHSE